MKTISMLLRFLKPFVGEVFLSCLLGIAAVGAGVGLLGTSAFLIASAALHPSIAELQVAIVGVRFFGISRAAFRYLERLVSHSVNLRVLSRLRAWFYQQLESTPPLEMFTFRSGDLLNRVMGNLETLDNFYVRVVSPLIVALVMGAASSVFLGRYASQLGMLLACGLFINGFIVPAFAIFATRLHSKKLTEERAALSSQTVEFLQGLEDIQSNGTELNWITQLQDRDQRAGDLQSQLSLFNGAASATSLMILNLTVLSLAWLTIPLVNQNELSGVSLAVILMVGMASFEAVGNLPQAAVTLTASLDAARQLFELARKGAISNPNHGEQDHSLVMDSQPHLVEVRGLSFEYPGDSSFSLNNINLTLERGKKVALVGPSGSGKTSIVNVLLHLWPQNTGSISFDDMESNRLDAYRVRSWFAVISQNTWLFSATLRENLLMANPHASEEQLWQAINLAELSGLVSSLPNGLDTWLGDQGGRISGGERQRVAIARALLQNRPFLILDEAVEHLDAVTASKIQASIFDLFHDTGLLVVTHDLRAMPMMDDILLMDQGAIVEKGSYESLIKSRRQFCQLMEKFDQNNEMKNPH